MNAKKAIGLQQNTAVKKEAMISALEKCLGVVTNAARMAQIDRSTHHRWLKEDQSYAERVDSICEMCIDFAESSLLKQVKDGNTTATIFYLKTKGKERGYVEKQEVEHSGSMNMITAPLSVEEARRRMNEIESDL